MDRRHAGANHFARNGTTGWLSRVARYVLSGLERHHLRPIPRSNARRRPLPRRTALQRNGGTAGGGADLPLLAVRARRVADRYRAAAHHRSHVHPASTLAQMKVVMVAPFARRPKGTTNARVVPLARALAAR